MLSYKYKYRPPSLGPSLVCISLVRRTLLEWGDGLGHIPLTTLLEQLVLCLVYSMYYTPSGMGGVDPLVAAGRVIDS